MTGRRLAGGGAGRRTAVVARRLAAGAAAAVLAGLLPGCAAWVERPLSGIGGDRAGSPTGAARLERPVPCGGGPFPSRPVGDPRFDVRIGALVFRQLGQPTPPGRFAAGAPALTVAVAVPPRTRAVIAVPPAARRVAGVDGWPAATTPAAAHRAVVCRTPAESQVFRVSFVVAGPRCVPVAVTVGPVTTTRRVPFGVPRC